MIVMLSSRSTITLPANLREALGLEPGDPLQVELDDGRMVLTPVAIVPRRSVLSESGQRKERAADAQIGSGKVKTFTTAEDLIEDLHADR